MNLLEDLDLSLPFDSIPYEPSHWGGAGYYFDGVTVEVCPTCYVACRVVVRDIEADSDHVCRSMTRERRTDQAPKTWLNSHQVGAILDPDWANAWN